MNDVKKIDAKGLGELLHPPKTSKGDYEKGGASELARRTGISDRTIREYLKLLDLEPEVQAAVQENKLPVAVGAVVGKLKEPSVG